MFSTQQFIFFSGGLLFFSTFWEFFFASFLRFGGIGKQISPQMILVDAKQPTEVEVFWFPSVSMTA